MTYQEEHVNRQIVVMCVFSAWEPVSQVVTRQCRGPRRGDRMLARHAVQGLMLQTETKDCFHPSWSPLQAIDQQNCHYHPRPRDLI